LLREVFVRACILSLIIYPCVKTAVMKIHQEVSMQNRNAAQDPPFRLQFWRRHYGMGVVRSELQPAIARQK